MDIGLPDAVEKKNHFKVNAKVVVFSIPPSPTLSNLKVQTRKSLAVLSSLTSPTLSACLHYGRGMAKVHSAQRSILTVTEYFGVRLDARDWSNSGGAKSLLYVHCSLSRTKTQSKTCQTECFSQEDVRTSSSLFSSFAV